MLVIFKNRLYRYISILLIFILALVLMPACGTNLNLSGTGPDQDQPAEDYADPAGNPWQSGRGMQSGVHLRFDRISLEEGLSQSTVFSILQDQQGFIWFGTEDGLNRFDGYNFTIFKHDPDDPDSLSSNWVQVVLEDAAGDLWIGTRDGGLNRYDPDQDQFTRIHADASDPADQNNDEITALYEDRAGLIWVGTGAGSLLVYDPEAEQLSPYLFEVGDSQFPGRDPILTIYQTRDGALWVGTNGGGLSQLDRDAGSLTVYQSDPDDPASIASDSIWSVLEDSSGGLWIGTSAGLDLLDRKFGSFTHYQNTPGDANSLADNAVRVLHEDASGALWIGTYGGGLDYFDRQAERFGHYRHLAGDPDSISSDIIISIFEDREGVLWYGTIGGGVSKLDLSRFNFTHYKSSAEDPNSLNSDMVRIVYQDQKETIWIGTMFGGLNRYDPQTQHWEHYLHDPNDPSSLSDNFVSDVFRDRSGVLWVGTIHGLDRFDPESETFSHYNVIPDLPGDTSGIQVSAIYESRDGKFWIGTTDGLYQFDREQELWGEKIDFNQGGAHSLYVYIIVEDDDGLLWIGTLGDGLIVFDPLSGEYTQYLHLPGADQSISQNFITALLIDHAGIVWIGTNGSGLDSLDPETGAFNHYREKDGLPNDSVYCLLGDENGRIWVSTNHGLGSFDPEQVAFSTYDRSDGLQSNEFNAKACLPTLGGEMIFGGINGFNVFEPGNIQTNHLVPPIVITAMSKNNEQILLPWEEDGISEVVLQWPVDSFEFEYAALSFAQPEKNQYAYYLEGFDRNWKEVGTRRFGEYTNLPGGTYTLRVRGSNNHGVWNDAGAAVQITVVPPYWQSWWFYGIVLIVLAGLFYGGIRIRFNNLEKRSRELKEQVEQRTAELMETQASLKQSEMEHAITEERNRLARDLHDSVTQSIYSLTLLAEAGQRMIKGGDISLAEENQNRLGKIAQQALQEMRLMVYELRPPVLQTEGLVGALEHRLEAVERRAGISAQMRVEHELTLSPDMEEELFHISNEALNNSLKHAKAAEITVYLKSNHDTFSLSVEDDGIGFDPALTASQGGMGLSSMAERVEKIGGSLVIDSEIGVGTKIKVNVPLESEGIRSVENSEVSE